MTHETQRRPVVATAELSGMLRRARVDGEGVHLRGSGADALRVEARGATAILDGHNAIAEIDGALTLSAAARRIARLGAVFPLARPLPPLTLTEACAALPLFVDAWVQQASLLSGDGDPAETPRAPRAAAGPSLLGALCSRPPLAIAIRARVRVMLASHAAVHREQHGSTRLAAERIRALLDDGRAFSVDAFGTTVLVLGGAARTTGPVRRRSGVDGEAVKTEGAPERELDGVFVHEGHGRRASFARSVSFSPGDVDAMTRALNDGGRVVAAPFIGRCGALVHGFEPLTVVDTARGVQALTASWTQSTTRKERS